MAQEGCACYFCCSLEMSYFLRWLCWANIKLSNQPGPGRIEPGQTKPHHNEDTKSHRGPTKWVARLQGVPAMRARYACLLWVPVLGADLGCPLWVPPYGCLLFLGRKKRVFHKENELSTTGTNNRHHNRHHNKHHNKHDHLRLAESAARQTYTVLRLDAEQQCEPHGSARDCSCSKPGRTFPSFKKQRRFSAFFPSCFLG